MYTVLTFLSLLYNLNDNSGDSNLGNAGYNLGTDLPRIQTSCAELARSYVPKYVIAPCAGDTCDLPYDKKNETHLNIACLWSTRSDSRV